MKIKYRCHKSETSLHNLPNEMKSLYFTWSVTPRPPIGDSFYGCIGLYLLVSRIGQYRYCSRKGLIRD